MTMADHPSSHGDIRLLDTNVIVQTMLPSARPLYTCMRVHAHTHAHTHTQVRDRVHFFHVVADNGSVSTGIRVIRSKGISDRILLGG